LGREGELYVREASPLFDSTLKELELVGCLRGAKPLFLTIFPLSSEERGTQGVR